jgi:hypothetical protein
MLEAARTFIAGADAVKDVSALGTPIAGLDRWLVTQGDEPTRDDLVAKVKQLANAEPADIVVKPAYKTERRRVADTLLARTVAPADDARQRAELLRAMYLFGLLERLAIKPGGGPKSEKKEPEPSLEIKTPQDVRELLASGTVLLPADVFPIPLPPDPDADLTKRAAARGNGRGAAAHDGDGARRLEEVTRALTELREALDDETAIAVGGDVQTAPPETGAAGSRGRAWTLSEAGVQRLSSSARAAIERDASTPTALDVPTLIARLERSASRLGTALAPAGAPLPVVQVGSALLEAQPFDGLLQRESARLPAAGLARRPAIAELMIVREKLLRYELGEVAHIENVLKGEGRDRTHRRKTTTEETLAVTTEREQTTEHELQTSDRFDLERETSTTISDDSRLETGVTVSAAYGPWVSGTANLGYTTNHAKSQAATEASSFGREVTDRSLTRLRERVQETRTRRSAVEVEETNKHTIDNSDGNGNVTGVYRWVDRVSSAQVVNYGRRLMLEFVVPEPAALHVHRLLAGDAVDGLSITKPQPPTVETPDGKRRPLTPADLRIQDYMSWVEKYAVAGVKPPPKPFATVGLALEEPPPGNAHEGPNRFYYKARKELSVPEGYRAKSFTGAMFASTWKSECRVAVGATWQWGTGPGGGPSDDAMPAHFAGSLQGEQGDLPVAVYVGEVWGYSFSLEVLCELTEEAFARWQLETYEAIIGSYLDLKARYDEELAAASTRLRVAILSRPPEGNRETERTELKRGAISLLTGQHFESYDAIDADPDDGLPEIDVGAAQDKGPEIQFFEQAIEWQQMTYTFYPYYWSRRSLWLERLAIDDPDPVFRGFLQAGAARVAVPVRPGFDEAVLHYLATGQVWEGGQVPQVGDDLYLSVVAEMYEQLGGPSEGVPVGEPWEVRVPTTLVALQPDGSLPVLS